MIQHAPSLGLGLGLSLRGSGVGFSGLLDAYPGAAAAYSLRALSASWLAEDVVDAQRSSDSATQGMTEAQINNGELLAFTGNSNGLNNVWYDQSGNSVDATNVSPSLISDGEFVLPNGPQFDGTNYYSTSNVNLGAGDFSVFTHVILATDTTSGIILGNSVGQWVCRVAFNAISVRGDDAVIHNIPLDSDLSADVKYTISLIRSGNTVSVWVNGILQTATISLTGTESFSFDQVAARGVGANAWDGKLSEILCYNSDQTSNREGIEANITNYYSPKTLDLFILLGQSNMVGAPSDNNPVTTPLSGALDETVLFNGSAGTPINDAGDLAGTSTDYETNGWILQSAYAAQSRFGYGPNLDFARTMTNDYSAKNLGILKWARNGTNLDDDWAKSSSKLYPSVTSYINTEISNLQAQGYSVRIKAFFWFQGHGDSMQKTRADAYNANLTQLASDFRADITGASGARFIVGVSPEFWKLPYEPGEPGADAQLVTNVDTIQTAQESFAISDGAQYIQTNDADYIEPWVSGVAGNEPIHLTSDSKQLLGIRAATAYSTKTNITN